MNIPEEQITWFMTHYMKQRAAGILINGGPNEFNGSRGLIVTGRRMGSAQMDPEALPDMLDLALSEATRLEYYELAAALRSTLDQITDALSEGRRMNLAQLIETAKREMLNSFKIR